MFTLVAASRKPVFDGVVATRTFDELDAAKEVMRQWARFGVDNLCDEADLIYICDSRQRLVCTWDRARKMPVAPA